MRTGRERGVPCGRGEGTVRRPKRTWKCNAVKHAKVRSKVLVPTVQPGVCEDREGERCAVWKRRGYCQKTKVYMEMQCCKTCKGTLSLL